MTDIKAMKVTRGFLSLSEEIKHCQSIKSFKECEADKYRKIGMENCKCIPEMNAIDLLMKKISNVYLLARVSLPMCKKSKEEEM